jgi:hypothetical protein
MYVCFRRGPGFGEHGGTLFFTAFVIKIFIKRYVKMTCKRVSLCVGAPFGNLGGITCRDILREKEMHIWVPFLDLEDIKILSPGTIWNFGKGVGLFGAAIRLWDTKGASVRPRYIGTVRTRTKCKLSNHHHLYHHTPGIMTRSMSARTSCHFSGFCGASRGISSCR